MDMTNHGNILTIALLFLAGFIVADQNCVLQNMSFKRNIRTQTMTSLGYPKPYKGSQDCSWNIYPDSNVLQMNFVHFNTRKSGDECVDHLQIDDKKYCGNVTEKCLVYSLEASLLTTCEKNIINETFQFCEHIYTSSWPLVVRFKSGFNYVGRNKREKITKDNNFNIKVTSVSCNARVNGNVGRALGNNSFPGFAFNFIVRPSSKPFLPTTARTTSGVIGPDDRKSLNLGIGIEPTTSSNRQISKSWIINTTTNEEVKVTDGMILPGSGEDNNLVIIIICVVILVILFIIVIGAVIIKKHRSKKVKDLPSHPPPNPPELQTDNEGYLTPVISGHVYQRPLPLAPELPYAHYDVIPDQPLHSSTRETQNNILYSG